VIDLKGNIIWQRAEPPRSPEPGRPALFPTRRADRAKTGHRPHYQIVSAFTGKGHYQLWGCPILVGECQAPSVWLVVLARIGSLGWLNRLTRQANAAEEAILNRPADRTGTILVRSVPNPENGIWRSYPNSPVGVRGPNASAAHEGTIETISMDGLRRLVCFTSILGSPSNRNKVFIVVGIPTHRRCVRADVRRTAFHNMIGLGVVALLALLAAWVLGDFFILRKVRALVRATKRLRGGDLTARSGLEAEPGRDQPPGASLLTRWPSRLNNVSRARTRRARAQNTETRRSNSASSNAQKPCARNPSKWRPDLENGARSCNRPSCQASRRVPPIRIGRRAKRATLLSPLPADWTRRRRTSST